MVDFTHHIMSLKMTKSQIHLPICGGNSSLAAELQFNEQICGAEEKHALNA